MEGRTLQGALTFLGFAISVVAVFYFAIEYIPRVSDWTQFSALVLLSFTFAFLGVYVRGTSVGGPFFGDRLRWLRPAYVLYLLAIFSAVTAEIRFLNIDSVPRPLKILASLLIGVGMILVVAWEVQRREKREAAEASDDGPQQSQ